MTLLTIYWSPSIFWWIILPIVVLGGVLRFRAAQGDSSGFDIVDVAATILLIAWVLLQSLTCFLGPPHQDRHNEIVANEIKGIKAAQEERFYRVKNLGKKQVLVNPADSLWYVRMGDGSMIGFAEIIANRRCRSCDQFKKAPTGDSIYVYEAYTSDSEWFNDPKTFFSQQKDIVLEEACLERVQ